MQDLKKNKKRVNQATLDPVVKEDLNNELQEDLTRGCNSKGCNCNKHHHDECECDCLYNSKHNNHNNDCYCEPCQVESDECIDNVCGETCGSPITPPRFSTANSVPFAIEVNRIFDTMKFQLFTEASAPNGEDLYFEYEVVSVNGPVPRSGVVNVNIEKICMNYTDVVIKPGCTTLEDHTVRALKEREKHDCEQENLCPDFEYNSDSEFCKTSFEYNVCGNKNIECCSQCKGERVAYKEKGLKVIVKNLVLELRGCCGCTEVTVLAYPSTMDCNGNLQPANRVVFNYNTLAAPICVPANGTSCTLRQNFQTALTVDCIGKTLLKFVDENCCECYYDFCIPNGIDLILCLEEIVSVLVNEQIVVLASTNAIDPRTVDTFSKVCDFSACCPSNCNTNNTNQGNGCSCNK